MSFNTEIFLNINSYENRIAIKENNNLKEIFIERDNQKRVVGNIYKGKIIKVLPGMQAAFVDIGLEKAGFLHLSEVLPLERDDEDNDFRLNKLNKEDINKWLRAGQEVLVQIVKESIGNKGVKLTCHLSVSSRFLVFLPDLDHIGISLRISKDDEKNRLQEIIKKITVTEKPRGYILRTAAEGATFEEIETDIKFLNNLWQDILDTSSTIVKPGIVYEDLNLIVKTINIFANDNPSKILVDNLDSYKEICQFADKYIPGLRDKVEHYQKSNIFEQYDIEKEINKALEKNVYLKSGGYLIIEQTEAMITIDINTGGFTGTKNLEETIFKTNLEATKEIAKQLRLRNLGGIIIIDFIDMMDENNKAQVLTALKKELELDKAKTTVSDISELGLVEMTRKRVYESLSRTLCQPCKSCNGKGTIKTLQTICYDLFREIQSEARNYPNYNNFLLISSEDVIKYIEKEESVWLAELELELEKNIHLKIEKAHLYNQYDIIPLN
ncbi:Rne/Rng family ribonuclease [Francisella adeliensis]|uniref:Ribonuclease G n=1 Tax=Francisella adeliensis TaxID=2007306 RepID=A0A2Z4Y0J9_9GAMM|nr:Rne/Rng family ribonuclease [Francisella adeliensis]AXA34667.1 ribonuclease E/G [Francisella adeliensis]MBK2086396.1 Rne/Rng family ribonuclease [Francisella adeliensis]MBK2096611.1 Rne/Rng family ribonuclease [Francisella adeliensis]QIW12911.1 Rne/Rng family ribonuclease [Francisella adeliensis]QIW14787.1 Rne/Rng family ribonuclease [Francisella adeliensis]